MKSNETILIQSFIAAARDFVDLVDRCEELEVEPFLKDCRRLLPLIFHLAVQLPHVELEDETESTTFPEVNSVNLSAHLGELDASYQVWDPIPVVAGEADPSETQVLYHGLGDDLSDIYRDLKGPLVLYDTVGDRALERCVYEWKLGFSIHYGAHLASAIKTLFWRLRCDED